MNLTGKSTQGGKIVINHMISKRGNINFELENDADIKDLTAGGVLNLTQKAQNLTINNIGLPVSSVEDQVAFNDILYHHDDLIYGYDPEHPEKTVVPEKIVISVLDAMDTPERADSNLVFYSAYVRGGNGDGSDVVLMADNIYAYSYDARNSKVHTKYNPAGVILSGRTYSNENVDSTDTTVYEATGINSYGDGAPLTLEVSGVNQDIVEKLVPEAQRDDYIVQTQKSNVPKPFINENDKTALYGYDYAADNIYISVNDYVYSARGVVFETIYADNAYVNTHDTNLSVNDGVISNYAEFRNQSKLAVVDNDYRRIVHSDMQLFTRKTGSFFIELSNSTIMKTCAPVVDFNPYHLVNEYSSENSFVNLTFKENAIRQEHRDEYKILKQNDKYYNKSVSLVYNTLGADSLYDTGIYEFSRTGATIDAQGLKKGQKTNLKFQLNDIDIDIDVKVKEIHGNKATVEFLNMPEEISNELMYEYMKKVNSMKNDLSSL